MEFNELRQRQQQLMLKIAKQAFEEILPEYNDKAQACLREMKKLNYKRLGYWFNVLQYEYDEPEDLDWGSIIEDIAYEIVRFRNREYLIMNYDG